MSVFTVIFLLLIAANLVVHFWLSARQAQSVRNHRDKVPDAFNDQIPLAAHQKAADYTLAKLRLGKMGLLLSTAILLWLTLGGGINLIDGYWQTYDWSNVVTGTALMLSVFILSNIIDLPLSAYGTFKVEQQFGFNKTTTGTFISDFIKETLLTILIGGPLIWVILKLMDSSGELWWLYAWLVWTFFSFFMMWAFPTFIAPLFNKFEPLSNESLRTRIESLMQKCGFKSNGIFVMDGSKRSGHGNAYFTGLGSNKRIVFFDTLLETLEPVEVEAVLAHELGHFKRHHIRKRMIVMVLTSLAGLAALAWLMQQAWFYSDLGVANQAHYNALLLFMLVAPIVSVIAQPLMSHFSRKHEFEADEFAAQNSDAHALVKALVKLYRDNASTLTPDPLYSAFHDSHPPAPIRVAHLKSQTAC